MSNSLQEILIESSEKFLVSFKYIVLSMEQTYIHFWDMISFLRHKR